MGKLAVSAHLAAGGWLATAVMGVVAIAFF